MKTYIVTWFIELEAADPMDAAEMALDIQRDKSSLATSFEVKDLETGKIVEVDPYFDKLKERSED